MMVMYLLRNLYNGLRLNIRYFLYFFRVAYCFLQKYPNCNP